MTFENILEAKAAFAMERTEFRRDDEAFVIYVGRNNRPNGHAMVRVERISGINGQGEPVYQCRLPDGRVAAFDATELHRAPTKNNPNSPNQLLGTPDQPTAYGVWFAAQQAEIQASASRMPAEPEEVTCGIYGKDEDPFASRTN